MKNYLIILSYIFVKSLERQIGFKITLKGIEHFFAISDKFVVNKV